MNSVPLEISQSQSIRRVVNGLPMTFEIVLSGNIVYLDNISEA